MFIGKREGYDYPKRSNYLDRKKDADTADYICSSTRLSLVRDDIKQFKPVSKQRPDDPDLQKAITDAAYAFTFGLKKKDRVPMLHLNEVFDYDLPIWGTSPCLPWIRKGYTSKAEVRDDPSARKEIRWFWHEIKTGGVVFTPDCCAYVRAQVRTKGKTKARVVWGYPATIVFGEAMFAVPLIEEYRRRNTPMAYGCETGKGGAGRINAEFQGVHHLEMYYKSFDKTVPAWLINITFMILWLNIDFVHYRHYGVARFDYMQRVWNFIVDYYCNTPIRLSNGERYRKTGGIATGSYFTLLVGSIANYILLKYASIKLENRILHVKVLGDYSISTFESKITPADVQRVLEPLGMTVDVEKSSYRRTK